MNSPFSVSDFRDALALCTLNSLTSFIAGFAVFSVLGFMSHELGVDIATVADSGREFVHVRLFLVPANNKSVVLMLF